MTAILVTGSRDWTDRALIASTLPSHPPGTILLHGNCGQNLKGANPFVWARPLRAIRGADLFCRDVANERGWIAIPFPYASRFGDRRGGPERNAFMVDVLRALRDEGHPVEAYAFPLPSSRGTWDCVTKVKAIGIEPAIVRSP